MAKRKRTTRPAPTSTADLAADPRNPRFISDQAGRGLSHSLNEFGDLSGIVWNRQTGSLVAGHKRLEKIEERWGKQTIEIVDAANELGVIRIDGEHCFTVRIVDWPIEKQVAANVTANNQAIQGEFTPDVVAFVRDIEESLSTSAPTLLDDVLLADLLVEFGSPQKTELVQVDVKPPPAMTWVLVGIATPRFGRIAGMVNDLASVPDIIIESTLNDGNQEN